MRVFVSGGTGYLGRAVTAELLARGHSVCSIVRAGSENKLAPGCTPLEANALDARSFSGRMPASDVFVHLTGVAHPSPAKAAQFRQIDQVSLQQSVLAAKANSVPHFVYVSVAQPAPVMKAYQQVRSGCEAAIAAAGLHATILRPWYVLGPGHRWPYPLMPLYWLLERIPSTRDRAVRLGLVTLSQMTCALVWAVENPASGVRLLSVSDIRRAGRDSKIRYAVAGAENAP
jgi:uncharacterized protein YbjT (DUF2867 family)